MEKIASEMIEIKVGIVITRRNAFVFGVKFYIARCGHLCANPGPFCCICAGSPPLCKICKERQ